MPNLMQLSSDLRAVPDNVLQRELTNPSGMVPSYLVLAEAQRRALTRQAAQQQQAQQQTQSGSVYDETLRNLIEQKPPGPPPPVGMVPPPTGQPSATLGTPPSNFRTPMQMADGGGVDDDYQPTSIPDAINYYSNQEGVDPNFANAIWHAEGHGGANTISPVGAIGPFQLMPNTARGLNVNPRDPIQNVHGGIRYIRQLRDQFGNNPRLISAAYNAGPNAVARHGNQVPPYPETQGYVKRVMKMYGPMAGTQGASDATANLPTGPMTIYNPETQQDEPASPPHEFTAPPEVSDQDADLTSITPPTLPPAGDASQLLNEPGPTAPATVAAAATPAAIPTLNDPWSTENVQAKKAAIAALMGNVDQTARHREVARLEAEAQELGRRNPWQMLADFGFGMAASPSHFAGVAIGQGGQAMLKALNARQDEARKLQLEAMGIDSKLDDEVQHHQDAINQATINAINQAAQHEYQRSGQAFSDLFKIPGAHYGPAGTAPEPGFTFTANPSDPRFGMWVPPQSKKVSADALPFMPYNETTGKPYAAGDEAPWLDVTNAEKGAFAAEQARARQKTTAADAATQLGIGQTMAAHPEYSAATNPDGSPKAFLHLNDLPAELRNEAQWRTAIAKDGWSTKNINGLLGDPNAPADLVQQAKNIQANQVKQGAAAAGARTTATQTAKQGPPGASPELSTAGNNQMREQSVVGSQFDDLIKRLEPYKNDNNPATLLLPLGKYKLGMVTPEGQLGNDISNLSLASIQGMMPFASKSRNYNFIKDIRQHLPNLIGFPPDSPANIYDKLLKARRNFLRMDRSSMQFEQKHGTTNPAAPMIDENRARVYYKLAGGDPDKARAMAQDDGWQFQTTQ